MTQPQPAKLKRGSAVCPHCEEPLSVAGNVTATGVDGFDGKDGRTYFYVCGNATCPVSVTDPRREILW